MTEAVLTTIDDGVAWITLNRPDSLNAIDDAVRHALPRAVDAADADPAVSVIVIRGAGPRAFCVGADIKEFATVNSPAVYRQERIHHHWVSAFDRAIKPVIASIHGHCLGGGLEIALACDIRIAADDASFGLPETGHGIIPAAGGTQRITRVLGMGVALDLILTGDRIDARHALSIGLISRITTRDTLEQLTRDVARKIASRPPLATQFAKEAVRQGAEMSISDGMRREIDLFTHLINTQDRLEAANAFKEKRKPVFTGR
jgi:enoyl-CoA hydratase/carnithine racemase